jgi:hypothetical protein
MKTIKATKNTKQFKVGDIKRVSDKEAESATADGYWMYISKSEWKKSTNQKNTHDSEGSLENDKTIKK